MQGDQGAVRLRLKPAYLWGDSDEISAAHSLCVTAEPVGRLFCNFPQDPAPLPADAAAANAGTFSLFLKPEFRTATWTVVASRRFTEQGGALANFFLVYLTVAVSAVLLEVLLSLVQIRRTLGPLQQLMAGARRIAAGDFTLVKVKSDDEFGELAGAVNDMATQLEEREQGLRHQARHDILTGLPNRRGLEEKIVALMAVTNPGAVLFVDLDRFKQINDNFGHKIGDKVLTIVAERLREAVGSGVVGRLAGDEFVVILETNAHAAVTALATRVLDALTDPFEIGLQRFRLSCSIGIALHPDGSAESLSALERADIAMYRAKQGGRNRYAIYNDAMTADNQRRQALESDLRRAIEEEQFFLQYQPKVNLVTGEIEGAEALVRWQHPQRGLIPPIEFIGMAEDLGLIVSLGRWILRTACAQNAAWRTAGLRHVRIAVNVAARQFAEPGFVDSVATILAESGLQPDGLEIELTETTMMTDGEQMIDVLNGLRNLGIMLALDDFGTGYSSLSYLKNFPVNVLKIDRSFISELAADQDDRLLVTAIIGIAHNLNMHVVAEGVETFEQLTYLRSQLCDEMQGYYFSRPVAAAAFTELLRDGKLMQMT